MTSRYGISGVKTYVPRLRVNLRDWCAWTGNSWPKTEAVVGRSFRMRAPHESIYTMAANAVLRLIRDYRIDPARVGFLGFGTESSTDNSAGAVIVKGMVDQALKAAGQPTLARDCEVPEFKHACLGGVYALKGAVRYLAHDGEGRQAIVVCGDIAEYERGTSGEPTQGAGAVAMLVEERPTMLAFDLRRGGTASAYRGPDFRKPRQRYQLGDSFGARAGKMHDYPVFSGKYSTVCYTDSTVRAVEDMLDRLRVTPRNFYHEVEGVLMHRPYRRMPVNAMAALYVWGLSHATAHLPELAALCEAASVDLETVLTEMRSRPDLFAEILAGRQGDGIYGQTMKVVRAFRGSDKFREVVDRKMALGADAMMDLGNLYSASLPAWIAAAFDEAAGRSDLELGHKQMLVIGYGSGDAAEAIPVMVQPGWRAAAERIGFVETLAGAVDLSEAQYAALHDTGAWIGEGLVPADEFVIERIGDRKEPGFQDLGLEYYAYVP